VVDEPILCIGGRSALDEAAAAILAEVLKKRGLIASLAGTEAKLVCLSYLGLGASPAHIRYLVRRLRRILPQGTTTLVCYWTDERETPAAKELLEAAEADAYATSLPQAVELCMAAAKGELEGEEAAEAPSYSPRRRAFPGARQHEEAQAQSPNSERPCALGSWQPQPSPGAYRYVSCVWDPQRHWVNSKRRQCAWLGLWQMTWPPTHLAFKGLLSTSPAHPLMRSPNIAVARQ